MNYITLSLNDVTITEIKVRIFILTLKSLFMSFIIPISIVVFLILFIILMIRRFMLQKKNVPGELYTEALRNENSGYFEMAIDTYEKALDEVNKTRYQDNNLKFKIIAKLKVLHTVVDYKNGFHNGR